MKRIPRTLLALLLTAMSAGSAMASPIEPATPNSGNYRTILQNFLLSIASHLEIIAGIAAVFFIVYYGVQYIMSAGNAEKAKAARSNLINAVIGIIIIVTTFTIINLASRISYFLSSLV